MTQALHGPATPADATGVKRVQPSAGNHADSPAAASGPALTGPAGPAHILGLQRLAGNRAVASRLNVSRQAVPDPAVPDPAAPKPATDEKFDKTTFIHDGTRFSLEYRPVGPLPAVGSIKVTLRVHIDFKDFTAADKLKEPFRSHRFTRSQLADFKWKAPEKEAFARDFQSSVQAGWSAKHTMATNDPTFAEHRAGVQVVVEIVDEAGKAHNSMSALKIPKGDPADKALPRFRSSVSGDTSQLEQRDVTETETTKVRDKPVTEQITGFENNSAVVTPAVATQVSAVAAKIKKANVTFGERTTPDGKKHDMQLFTVGRATSPGSAVGNDKLGQQRADAVLAALLAELPGDGSGTSTTAGELNATEEEKFRRVDVIVSDMGADGQREVTQNTAAHEAGHMFGLGDEYVDEKPPSGAVSKFTGDKSSHYGDVEAELGTEAADETLVKSSGSMMSSGSDVLRGHYVPFLKSVEQITGKQWTVK